MAIRTRLKKANHPSIRTLGAAATLLGLLALPGLAQAQAFPNRPIKMICPFTAGGSIDKLARLVSRKMEESLNQPVLVENRGGAGGVIGTKAMIDSKPDGYTIAILSPGSTSIPAALDPKLPYNIEKDMTYIVALASYVGAALVAQDFPPRTVKELVDYVKKNPGKVTFGSAGVGSSVHMMGELFAHAAGVKMTHIPFKGGGNGITDLLGGHVSIVMSSLAAAGPLISSGKLRALVAFDNQRYPTFPQVPAVTEDLPHFDPPVIWYGLAGPAGLPQPITELLNREAQKAMATPELKKEIVAGAYKVIGGSPRDYQELMRRDTKSMGDIVKSAGIKLE